jgi:DNA-binding transcriptional MerR regulator
MSQDTPTPDPGGADIAFADLCALVDLPPRTVRFYIQRGLVDRPVGETRAARYGARHVDQLLSIKRWTAAGLSLDRIALLLKGAAEEVPRVPRAVGEVEVCSHLYIADGVELVINPSRAGLSPNDLRALMKIVVGAYRQLRQDDHN